MGAAVTTGVAVKRGADARERAEIHAIQTEQSALQTDVEEFRQRMRTLRWTADKMRAGEGSQGGEADPAWERERARIFENLINVLDRSADEARFATLSREIAAACTRGDVKAARERLHQLPDIRFPSPKRWGELRAVHYSQPLAALSRQNPGYYRAFKVHEPEAAQQDIAELRREIATEDLASLTPQSVMKLELLSAVAPAEDPLVEDYAAVAGAADHFENPDAATIAAWRRAQRALRAKDWQTATTEMQAILRTTVRTKQPFRAAYGRTLIKNKPDDPAAAYAFMEEAAAMGDGDARKWLVEEELAKGDKAKALPWLEAAVLAGEVAEVPRLLELYASPRDELPRDLTREAGVLQRVIVGPDAPPLALMLLARLYEEGGGVGASPEAAFACYRRAAEKQHVPAWPEMARCCLRGQGTPQDLDRATSWACRAVAAGEREKALPILIEVMRTAPERAAHAVQEMFEHLSIAGPSGFHETRLSGTSMANLQMLLARYLDLKGRYGEAARFYQQSGSRDPGVMKRRAELTAVRPCDTCAGVGKVKNTAPCPTCGGKGTVLCPVCDGRGYSFAPGSPPCSTCAGAAQITQDGRSFVCPACGGTGKGKASVTKQTCPSCSQGRTACRDCTGGRIVVTKECPDCHGDGSRALAND